MLVFSYLPSNTMLKDFSMLNQVGIAGLSPGWSWHEMLLLRLCRALLWVFMSVFLKDIVLGPFM